MFDNIENPIIRNCERTGYPDGKSPKYPICPICGDECDTVYKNQLNDIVGCDNCIERTSNDEGETCGSCGQENPEDIYCKDSQIIGCSECLTEHDAWDEMAHDEELSRWDH